MIFIHIFCSKQLFKTAKMSDFKTVLSIILYFHQPSPNAVDILIRGLMHHTLKIAQTHKFCCIQKNWKEKEKFLDRYFCVFKLLICGYRIEEKNEFIGETCKTLMDASESQNIASFAGQTRHLTKLSHKHVCYLVKSRQQMKFSP